jgi:GrpB-like predicted nucleotidyltransferase (UPF0157 family)
MTVRIVPYDPAWPDQFASERDAIVAAGGDRILVIEHFGSTSVPGLAAKPVLDIAVAVDSVDDDGPALTETLAPLGYRPEPSGMRGRLLLIRVTADGEHTHHLHILPLEGWDVLSERLFRDWLREHDADRDRYAAVKNEVAAREEDPLLYTKAKTALIQELVDAARDVRGLPPTPVWID